MVGEQAQDHVRDGRDGAAARFGTGSLVGEGLRATSRFVEPRVDLRQFLEGSGQSVRTCANSFCESSAYRLSALSPSSPAWPNSYCGLSVRNPRRLQRFDSSVSVRRDAIHSWSKYG